MERKKVEKSNEIERSVLDKSFAYCCQIRQACIL